VLAGRDSFTAVVGRSGRCGPTVRMWRLVAGPCVRLVVLCWRSVLSRGSEEAPSTFQSVFVGAHSLPAGVQATVGGCFCVFSIHMHGKTVSGTGFSIMPV